MRVPFLSIIAAAFLFPTAANAQTILRAETAFDGTTLLDGPVIIRIEDGQILDVQTDESNDENPQETPDDGAGVQDAAGAAYLNLGSCTLLPGLIDVHTHLLLHEGDYDEQILRETPEYRALRASVSARKTLHAGITTVRDLWNEGAGYADIALRDAVQDGFIDGPDVFAAIQPVTSSGAYRLTGYTPYGEFPPISYAADGPDEIRTQVRRLVAEGADQVKAYLESFEKRHLSPDSLTGALNYSEEELSVLVDEARRGGLTVAAHVYSDDAARLAIDAGVHSIEHGLYLTSETFRRMKETGIYYVPTLNVYELWRDERIFSGNTVEMTRKLTYTVDRHTESFQRALQAEVSIAFGSDTFENPGENADELIRMAAYGMAPVDVLRAATSVAAKLLGHEHEIGQLQPGYRANIIALHGNPLEDMDAVRDVGLVIKDGMVLRNSCSE